MEKVDLQFKKLHSDAKIPQYATKYSVGFDFYLYISPESNADNLLFFVGKDLFDEGEIITDEEYSKRMQESVLSSSEKEMENNALKMRDEFTKSYIIKPGEQRILSTGLSVVVPIGYELQIRPRSGLSAKYGFIVVNSPGTIDPDYRGEICIILKNTGTKKVYLSHGCRIAQGILNKVTMGNIYEISDFSENDMKIDRGGGFGSTGTKSLTPR